MVTSTRRCGIFLSTLLVVESDAVPAEMYGSSAPHEVTGQTVPVGALLIVDQENGSGTLVGVPIADQGLVGMAFNSGGGHFGSTRGDPVQAGSTLVRVDPNSGDLIETIGTISDGASSVGISDLAFQPGTDALFGISTDDPNSCLSCLYRIDTESAVATLIGRPGVAAGGGLGFGPDGTLYLATKESHSGDTFDPLFEVVTLDPGDASVLSREDALLEVPQQAHGLTIRSVRFDGLGVRPGDGALFVTHGGGGREIYQRVILAQGPRWRLLGESSAHMTDLDFAPAAEPLDTDGDTLPDAEDPCVFFPNTLPLMTSGFSGIPDECLCGDFDGDGFHSATDAAAINDCAAFISFACVSERDEVAAPIDGFYSATDADLVNRVAAFLDPAYALTCTRRPEGTCGGDSGVSCF